MLSLYVMPNNWCLMVGEFVHLSGLSIFVVVTQGDTTCRSYGTVINRKTVLNEATLPKTQHTASRLKCTHSLTLRVAY